MRNLPDRRSANLTCYHPDRAVTATGRTSRAVRDPPPEAGISVRELDSIAIVGAGRLGTALAAALRAAGHAVLGPLGRGADARGAPTPCSCACRTARSPARPPRSRPGRSSATAPAPPGSTRSAPHEAFSLHPLMTVPAEAPRDVLAGAGCAVAGTTPRALAAAEALARARSGMRADAVADEDRAAYHAAASIASNFLVTLEGAAERLAATAGVDRGAARAARARDRRELGGARRRAGAHRPDRARRRGDRRAPARGGRGARRPTCCRCSTRWSRRARRARRWRDEDRPHRRRAARARRRGARRRALGRRSCRRWAPSTPATTR